MEIVDILLDDFGIKVKKKLLDINMKQCELAKKVGISDVYLNQILNEKKEALYIRRKILNVLNAEESRCVVNE